MTGEDRTVIEAVPGLADRLLDGETTPERWVVTDGAAEAAMGRAYRRCVHRRRCASQR